VTEDHTGSSDVDRQRDQEQHNTYKKQNVIMDAAGATSPISAAMVAVMVRAGENNAPRPLGTTAALPVTNHHGHGLANARPMPSMTAVSTPERAAGKVTRQMVCQRVAPSARAASRYARGTASRASSATETMVGMEIAASSRAPESALNPVVDRM